MYSAFVAMRGDALHNGVSTKGGALMKTKELADYLGIADVTLRQWSSGEWAEYLTPGARGGGRNRIFTEQDARVLAAIVDMKAAGQTRASIHASLKALQADEWRDLPPMPPPPPGSAPVSMVPREAAEARIDEQRRALVREIGIMQDTITRLETDLQAEREQRADLQTQLTTAREELGELRGKLAMLSAASLPARAVLVGVLVVTAVVVVVVLLIVLARPMG